MPKTPILLQHTFATRLLESEKVGLLTLASILGHSSLDQVMRYAQPPEQRKAEAIQQKQPKLDQAVTLLDTYKLDTSKNLMPKEGA